VKRRKVDAEAALNDTQKQLATHKQSKVQQHQIRLRTRNTQNTTHCPDVYTDVTFYVESLYPALHLYSACYLLNVMVNVYLYSIKAEHSVLLRQASQRKARLDTESAKVNEQRGSIQTTIQEVCVSV
jgi:hypothetical protein